jgi:hypothetical protein
LSRRQQAADRAEHVVQRAGFRWRNISRGNRSAFQADPFLPELLERRLLLTSVVKFTTESLFQVGTGPFRAVTMDLNGDGKADLITSNYYGNTVSVLLGNGNGTFGVEREFAAGIGAYGLTLTDVSGDGKPDLAVVNSFNGTVSVLLGNGNGSFLPQQTFAVGSHPHDVVIADVNEDGKQDLAVSNNSSGMVSLLSGTYPLNWSGEVRRSLRFRPSPPITRRPITRPISRGVRGRDHKPLAFQKISGIQVACPFGLLYFAMTSE